MDDERAANTMVASDSIEDDSPPFIDRLANIARETYARRSATWYDFLHSKQFRLEVDAVFATASKIHRDDGVMDTTELQVAIDLLYEKLQVAAQGRLPKPGASAAQMMHEFDCDKSGTLDGDEFHRLSMRYFSKLEWPFWRVFLRGTVIGLIAYAAHEVWISPTAQNFYWNFIYPKIIEKLRKRYQRRYARRVEQALKNIPGKRPMKEAEILELDRIARLERRKRQIHHAKAAATAGIIGGASASAGIL